MGKFELWHIARAWKLREPLAQQWKSIEPDLQESWLAAWIQLSEHDPWTYDQLRELLDSIMDSGDVPPGLNKWALEDAAGRRRTPARRGPKSDPHGDFGTFVDVVLRAEFTGISKRAACREIGKETNRSPEAVASSAKRGGEFPLWPRSE